MIDPVLLLENAMSFAPDAIPEAPSAEYIETLKADLDAAEEASTKAYNAMEKAKAAWESARSKGLKCEGARAKAFEKAKAAWNFANSSADVDRAALKTARWLVVANGPCEIRAKIAKLWLGDHLSGLWGLGYKTNTAWGKATFDEIRAVIPKTDLADEKELEDAFQTLLRGDAVCHGPIEKQIDWAVQVATWKRRRSRLREELGSIAYAQEANRDEAFRHADARFVYASDAEEFRSFIVKIREIESLRTEDRSRKIAAAVEKIVNAAATSSNGSTENFVNASLDSLPFTADKDFRIAAFKRALTEKLVEVREFRGEKRLFPASDKIEAA